MIDPMRTAAGSGRGTFNRFRGPLILLIVLTVGSATVTFGAPAGVLASPALPFSGLPSQLNAPDGVGGDDFGWATAVSGQTAVLGAYGHDAGAGAAYVFTGAPWTQQAELQASDRRPGDRLGEAVAVSGTTAAIGAPGSKDGTGAVYVFGYSGGAWAQEAELTAPDGQQGDSFGQALVLSGTTLIIGAPGRQSSAGTAYVFTGSGATWAQDAELTAPAGAPGDGFASAIALAGSTAIFGAPQAGSGGAAYIFAGAGSAWSEQAELSQGTSGSSGDEFGYAVGLTASTAFVGAPGRTAATGAVFLFSFAGGTWSSQATLVASDGETGYKFGISLAVSNSIALVGSSTYRNRRGAVYAFGPSGGDWQQAAEFKASSNELGTLFGESVSLSGTTAVVGSYRSQRYVGSGYVFTQGASSSAWSQSAELLASDGHGGGDVFGRAVALDGTTLVVGAPGSKGEQGAAYVYTSNGSSWSLAAEITDPGGRDGDMFGSAVAISGRTIVIGAPAPTAVDASAYVYHQSGSGWVLQSTLVPASGHPAHFGNAVAVSASTAVVSASEGVYVFSSQRGIWSQVQTLTPADGASGDRYGFAVGLSRSALVVGAPGHDAGAGIAYFYGLDQTDWTLKSELAGSDPAGGNVFGSAVAVSGTTAIVGAPGANNAQNINGHTGTAYVFSAANGTWSQQAEVLGSDLHVGQVYGASVAISGRGHIVAAGAPGGRVYVFANTDGRWSQVQLLTQPPQPVATFDPIYGRSVAVSSSLVVAGATGSNSRAGAVFITTR
jgi:hypothetical protein